VPYTDGLGRGLAATALLFVPPSVVDDGTRRAPLLFAAGYPVTEEMAAPYVADGWVVATTGEPSTGPDSPAANPLSRGPNLDLALLHIVRGMPFVDDTRVFVSGGSAGGYMALMVAAETFPLAGVVAECPPLNLAYLAAYAAANDGVKGVAPALEIVIALMTAARELYGDLDDPRWLSASPLAHLDTITAPASLFFSTADVLVPINQLDPALSRPPMPALAAAGYVTDAVALDGPPDVRATFVERVPAGERSFHFPSVPDGAEPWPIENPGIARLPMELPVGPTQWTVSVIDEGSPAPEVGHYKAAVAGVEAGAFVQHHLHAGPQPGSLTPRKLERLMDRWAGREWITGASPQLGTPATEREDVLRSLRTFAVGLGFSDALAAAYRALPPEKQAFGPGADLTPDAWTDLLQATKETT
jgi:hypothetical protein